MIIIKEYTQHGGALEESTYDFDGNVHVKSAPNVHLKAKPAAYRDYAAENGTIIPPFHHSDKPLLVTKTRKPTIHLGLRKISDTFNYSP